MLIVDEKSRLHSLTHFHPNKALTLRSRLINLGCEIETVDSLAARKDNGLLSEDSHETLSPDSQDLRNLSESVNRQLNMYALAAGAAGVGMLALGQAAQAKIIYKKTHHVIGRNGALMLDLNHDGTVDFTIKNQHCFYGASSCTSSSWNRLTVAGPSGNAVEGTNRNFNFWAADLKPGIRVPNKRNFAGSGMLAFQCNGVACSVTSRTHTSGNWPNVRDRYLGLKFQIHDETHYGWARLSVQTSKMPIENSAILTGYAYETIPNKPIIAGKTDELHVITTHDALGKLALGRK